MGTHLFGRGKTVTVGVDSLEHLRAGILVAGELTVLVLVGAHEGFVDAAGTTAGSTPWGPCPLGFWLELATKLRIARVLTNPLGLLSALFPLGKGELQLLEFFRLAAREIVLLADVVLEVKEHVTFPLSWITNQLPVADSPGVASASAPKELLVRTALVFAGEVGNQVHAVQARCRCVG